MPTINRTPGAGRAAHSPADTNTHTVKTGDTLSGIARANGTTVDALVAANRDRYPSLETNPNQIQAGWTLNLRAPAAAAAAAAAAPAAAAEPAVVPRQEPSAPDLSHSTVTGGGGPAIDVGRDSRPANDPRLQPRPVSNANRAASVNPVGEIVRLNTDAIKPADDVLNLNSINTTFNPLKAQIGAFEKPSEMFQGKAFWPARDTVGGLIKGFLAQVPEGQRDMMSQLLAPVPGAISENLLSKTAAHQFAVGPNGEPGNVVTLYGGDVHHADIDKVIQELGDKGMRALKVMSHINHEGQGGPINSIISDGVGGVTHTGGFSAGMINGKPASIKSDWPSDYGRMADSNRTYNAVLMAVDYQAGTRGTLTDKDMKAYKHNADMWDCFAGMSTPFAGSDRDSRHTNYQFNPLEVYDAKSRDSVARTLSSVDKDKMLKEQGAFYCAEGQYSVANLGPADACLLKESTFGDSRAGKMIKAFQSTPGMTKEELRNNPEKGWEYLKTIPVEQGGITEQEFAHLQNTDRTATYLEFVPEGQKGWEKADPINKEGLIAKPMTIATMAWSLLRTYMPIETLSSDLAKAMTRAYNEGDAGVKAGIKALLQGNDPTTPMGQAVLDKMCDQAVGGMMLNILSSEDFKNKLFQKAGFEEITNDADKAKVMDIYKEFLGAVKDTAGADQATRDAAIGKIDDKFRNLEVERNVRVWDEAAGQDKYIGKKTTVMLYAAPFCNIAYAQQPQLHESSIRYVTNLQHADQATEPPAGATPPTH